MSPESQEEKGEGEVSELALCGRLELPHQGRLKGPVAIVAAAFRLQTMKYAGRNGLKSIGG